MNLYLDGTDESGCWTGDRAGLTGPWTIFDADLQDWTITARWRWLAIVRCWLRYRVDPAREKRRLRASVHLLAELVALALFCSALAVIATIIIGA